MATNEQADSATTPRAENPPRAPTPRLSTPATPAPTTVASPAAAVTSASASDSSDEGIRLSQAAARRFARRRLRRHAPTPDLVTSLVRPPSPDPLYIAAPIPPQVRRDGAGVAFQYPSAFLIPHVNPDRRSGPLMSPHPSSLDIPKRYGGDCIFDMYSLTYVTEADVNLLCPICHDPMVDPVTTPCDHTFCYRCIRQSIESSPSGTACPVDRDPLVWPNCFSAARLIRVQLNNLLVKCPFHARGCKAELRREAVETHSTIECRFRDFTCPGADCDKRLRVKPTDDICPHEEIRCSRCQTSIDAPDRELHMLTCTQGKTRCEGCWKLVHRNQLQEHREAECDGAVIPCPYSDLGCPVRTLRSLMGGHTQMCAFHPDTPSGMIIRSQRELIDSYTNLGTELQQLNARHDEALRRITEFTSPLSRNGGGDSVLGDSRTIQDLDAGFEEVHQNLTHLEARQSMWTLNQVMPIREEVTELRNNISMMRMQVSWLLNRSREEGRLRAANTAAGSTGIRRDGPGEGGHSLTERRRSTSADADLPRL